MIKNNKSQPALAYIDEEYKIKLDQLKNKHKDDPDHFLNRLELKQIYILSISLALKNKYKPKKSNKKTWIIRTEYLKDEDMTLLKSLIYSFCKNIKILLPENSSQFYEICEELANAGMNKAIELLENSEDIEKIILAESKNFDIKK